MFWKSYAFSVVFVPWHSRMSHKEYACLAFPDWTKSSNCRLQSGHWKLRLLSAQGYLVLSGSLEIRNVETRPRKHLWPTTTTQMSHHHLRTIVDLLPNSCQSNKQLLRTGTTLPKSRNLHQQKTVPHDLFGKLLRFFCPQGKVHVQLGISEIFLLLAVSPTWLGIFQIFSV